MKAHHGVAPRSVNQQLQRLLEGMPIPVIDPYGGVSSPYCAAQLPIAQLAVELCDAVGDAMLADEHHDGDPDGDGDRKHESCRLMPLRKRGPPVPTLAPPCDLVGRLGRVCWQFLLVSDDRWVHAADQRGPGDELHRRDAQLVDLCHGLVVRVLGLRRCDVTTAA